MSGNPKSMTFIRPQLRRKIVPTPFSRPEPGTFLGDIVKNNEIERPIPQKRPVHQQDRYLKALKLDYEFWGVEYKDRELPPSPEYKSSTVEKEPFIPYADHIQVTMTILKSGKVKIKTNPCMYDMHQKYWKNGDHPPQKTMIKNLKSLGFSDRFIKKVEKSYKRIPAKLAAFQKCIDSVFNRPSIHKTKKKKAEPKPEPVPVPEDQPQPEVEDIPNDENDEEDTIQGEDYTMDVEVDPDDDDEAANEEEFIDND